MMYAIWCKLKTGEEGWFYDFDFDGSKAVIVDVVSIQLLHPHYTCSKSAEAVRKASNVLSAEAREVVVVEKTGLQDAIVHLRCLEEYDDQHGTPEQVNATRALIGRLEAICSPS